MKKRMILITIVLFVAAIGISLYFSNRKIASLSVIEKLPIPKPHEHIAADGTVVEHQHTYKFSELSEEVVEPVLASETKHPIQRAWESLDLASIKRDYQKYTVAEMRKMWDRDYSRENGPFGNFPQGECPVEKADRAYPRDEWLERQLALGQPFVTYSDYRNSLGLRRSLLRFREDWETGTKPLENKADMISTYSLPEGATWETFEDAYNKFLIVTTNRSRRAREVDPSIRGGTTSLDGTFIPFTDNTVYIHISPDTELSVFTGTKLTQAQKDDLSIYGIVPEGVNVVYLDENDKPLSPGTPVPRFYERRMRALKEAQTFIQQQIENHELLLELDTLPNPPKKKETPVPDPHEFTPDRAQKVLQSPETGPSQQQQHPDARGVPPQLKIPPELQAPDAIHQWFTELELLHGGQLPRDLKTLQEVITELEKVRREGEAKLKPPQRPGASK